MMKVAGVNVVRLPARSPNLNAYAKRFVLSIKTEYLERMVPLGEWHVRRAIWSTGGITTASGTIKGRTTP
jgi:hypothetical protein